MWPFTQVVRFFKKKAVEALVLPPMPFKRSTENGSFLTDDERALCREETCPDCGTIDKFIGGPTGGMAVNFYCGNINCGSRFNAIFPFGVQRISKAEPLKLPNDPQPVGLYRG